MNQTFQHFLAKAQKIVAEHRAQYQDEYLMKGGVLKSIGHAASNALGGAVTGIGDGWSGVRNNLESAGSVVGNYLLPGSSLLSDKLVSKGAQNELSTPIGQIAQIGSGLAGSGVGSSVTGLKSAADIGAGWTNALNGAGNLVSSGSNIGTGISDAASNIGNKVSNGFSSLFGGGAVPGANESISPALAAADPTLTNSVSAAAAAPTAAAALGGGGGSSSYGPLLTALGGGANSLYSNKQAQKDLTDAGNQALGTLSPYLTSGAAANSRLSDVLGTSGNTTAAGYGSLTTPFTAASLQNDPGYQFQLNQGDQALARRQAASGNFFSGSALKAAQDYGQGLADTTLNQAFARDQATKQQTYGELAGQSGQGANAAGTAGNIMGTIGTAKAGADINSGNILNQTLSGILSGSGGKKAYNIGGQTVYI